MKRKLFSAILFGALLTASTSGLTSCKDYDDDISNLQSQIDKLATADQLSAKVSEMQAAIAAAQSAAESKAAAVEAVAKEAKAAAADAAAKAQSAADEAAKAKAAAAAVEEAMNKKIADLAANAATKEDLEAAKKLAADAVAQIIADHATDKAAIEKTIAEGLDAVKDEIAATNKKLADLATRLDTVEAKLAALEAGEGQEEALKEIQEEVELIAEALEDIIGEYTSMVTDVSLWTSNKLSKDYALNFVYVSQEKDATFPATEGLTDAQIEFSSKNKNVMTKDSLIVRVSPTNAVLAPENFSLINSQGKEISDLVEIESVKPYNKLITKSVEGNGLYNVVFKVKEGVTPEQLLEATAVKKGNKYNQILFAVAVKNTESNDLRRVVSSYDVTVAAEDYEPSRRDFQVTNLDGKWNDVAKIHNRFFYDAVQKKYYAKGDDPKATEPTLVEGIKDYKWNNEPQVEGTEKQSSVDVSDLRYNEKLVEVAVGQSIEISVGTELVGDVPAYNNNVNATAANIKGFYVLLDKNFAIESAPTEFNMWKRYDYTNVGVPSGDSYAKKATMFYGSTGSISIDSEDAEGDIIGFRVFAVNLDGTLVDPDGRAFYVQVGKIKEAVDLTDGVVVEAVLNPADDSGRGSAHFVYDATGNSSNYNGIAVANGTAFGSLNATGNKATAEFGIVGLNDGDACPTANYGWEIITNPSNYGNNTILPVHGRDYKIVTWTYNKVNYAQVYILNPLKFIDDKTYTAKTTVYNANGTAVNDITVSFKKVIPTVAPTLYWAAGYDATKQVFTNAANDYVIQHGPAATPAAVELKSKVEGLGYGAATGNSWYTLKFQNVASKAPTKVLAVPANDAWKYDGVTANTIATAYDLAVATKDIDAKSHEIVYDYYFGQISRTYNYTTAAYSNKTTDARVTKSGAATLAMTFGSWIDYEQIKWNGDAPTLTYYIGGALPGAPQYINLVGAGGTPVTGIFTKNGFIYKQTGTDYYQVKWNNAAGDYLYVNATGAFLANQRNYTNEGVRLADTTGLVQVTTGGGAGKILAWNTVTGNYDATVGGPIFGVAGNEVSFGNLVPENGVGYNYICNFAKDLSFVETIPNKWITVRFNSGTASEAFKAEYDGVTRQIKLTQQVNTANPVSEGTIYIKGADCFGHYKEWSLKVNIAH